VLAGAARWLASLAVTRVAMEATGICAMPACHALVEHGDLEKVLACNAGHVKNVPGRKTDLADAEWLAQLLECGLLAGSFIAPAEIKAARDVIGYRARVARQRVSEIAGLGSVLPDAGIKIDSVASSIAARSGRLMIEALIDGERRGPVPAGLAKGKMRAKIPDLAMALEGRSGGHHALTCRLHPDHIDHLEAVLARLDAQIEAMMTPLRAARDLLTTIPGAGPPAAAAVISGTGVGVREFFPGAAHPASRAGICPGNHEPAGKRRPGRRRHGNAHPRPVPAGSAWAAVCRDGYRKSLPPARHEMGRVPQPARQEQGDHRGRPCDPADHRARPGHRKTLRRTRRRLLHPPPGPRTGNPPPDRPARGPRPPGHPPASRLIAPARDPAPLAPAGCCRAPNWGPFTYQADTDREVVTSSGCGM
jgi:transposase